MCLPYWGSVNPHRKHGRPGGELRFSLLGSQVLESGGNRIAAGHWFAFLPRGLVGETVV